MAEISWRFYLVFICLSFFYVLVIYFFFPETKGRTLEEIGALFGDAHVANQWYGLSEEERAGLHKWMGVRNGTGQCDEENSGAQGNTGKEIYV
jgi:hypothetical protein